MSVEFFDDLIDNDMDNEVGKMANADNRGNYLNRLIDGCECFRMSFIEDARAELASLRAAVAERDAAIARAVAEEAKSIAEFVKQHYYEYTGDYINSAEEQLASAIRERGEGKE